MIISRETDAFDRLYRCDTCGAEFYWRDADEPCSWGNEWGQLHWCSSDCAPDDPEPVWRKTFGFEVPKRPKKPRIGRCGWLKEDGEWLWIPMGCWGGVIYGPIGCTCAEELTDRDWRKIDDLATRVIEGIQAVPTEKREEMLFAIARSLQNEANNIHALRDAAPLR